MTGPPGRSDGHPPRAVLRQCRRWLQLHRRPGGDRGPCPAGSERRRLRRRGAGRSHPERWPSALAALLGVEPDGLAFTESASAARRALLAAWPLAEGDTIAVVASEWGPNLEAFSDRGLRVAELACHGDGQLDLEHLERFLASSRPAAVHLTQVASHRHRGRAYHELELAGLVEGRGRPGTVVRAGPAASAEEQRRQQALAPAVEQLARAVHELG